MGRIRRKVGLAARMQLNTCDRRKRPTPDLRFGVALCFAAPPEDLVFQSLVRRLPLQQDVSLRILFGDSPIRFGNPISIGGHDAGGSSYRAPAHTPAPIAKCSWR